jgi:hypothetical protein
MVDPVVAGEWRRRGRWGAAEQGDGGRFDPGLMDS